MSYAEIINHRLRREIKEQEITLEDLYSGCKGEVPYSALQLLYKSPSYEMIENINYLEIICEALNLDLLKVMSATNLEEVVTLGEELVEEVLIQCNERWNYKDVIRYIELHYHEQITLDEIANHFFINKFHLAKSFKKKVGMTIFQYIKKLRIDKATALLTETDYSVSEIANICGYRDVSYFYRVFKETKGVTANEYRNGSRK